MNHKIGRATPKVTLMSICCLFALVYADPQNRIYAQNKIQEGLTPPINNGRIMGAFFAGVAGGILGSVVFAYAGAAIIGPHGGEDPGMMGAVIGLYTLPTVGGIIGFNATRRSHATSEFGTGLVDFRSGQLSLAAPTIYFQRHPAIGRLTQSIDLVKLRF